MSTATPAAAATPAPAEPNDRPLLLVVATGPQDYREYLFVSLATRDRIHLLNTAATTWEGPHLLGADLVPTSQQRR